MRGAAALLALAAAATTAAAEPAPDPRRRVAVVAVRQDSDALPDIAVRVTRLLGERTSLALVGVDAARASYGASFDADLVSCTGRAPCLAGIGRKLGVADVLLVAVSEFGDVILTVQRIEAGSGRVAGRIADALAGRAQPSDGELLGYLERVLPAGDFRRFGVLRVLANVAGASVEVGGLDRGRTPLAPLRLSAPASYDILVEKPGFDAFRASVAVPPGAEVLVRSHLSRRAERTAWYQRWWVVALAGTVAVATVIVVSNRGGDVPVRIEPF
jgi:hypothetical protein